MVERVQKLLSQWGIASRREAEKLILRGRVRLNGTVVHLGQKADPSQDRLEVDGKMIKVGDRPRLTYLLLNKPKGVISTCHDPKQRRTVLDLLPETLRQGKGIHPVGRLDADSTGALLLTNDGEFTLNLTHPRYHLPKTYQVWLEGQPSDTVLQTWRQGVVLEGVKTLPAEIKVLHRQAKQTLLEIVLVEGKNRQIRRVAEQLGFSVLQLHRIAIGSVKLQKVDGSTLAPGKYRFLQNFEINELKLK